MNYFKDCQTVDQAKNLFRKLVKQLHPDTSGYDSQADFVNMYKQFESFRPTKDNFNQQGSFNAEKFYNTIKLFDGLTDIKITFVGSFIWLEDIEIGAMYRQKDTIKAIKIDGYNNPRWANKKKSWYFSPLDYKQKFKSNKTLEQIKDTWGKQEFKTKQRLKIN